MRRRRLHGLGGSPAHHEKEAKKFAKDAVNKNELAVRFAEKGMCQSAVEALMAGSLKSGMAFAHGDEAGGMTVSDSGRVYDSEAKAYKAIDKVCLRPGAINGLRKRRK
jgi:hypothetical protein